MELEQATLICLRKGRLLYMMIGCTHLSRTESRMVRFLFYDDCLSYIHKIEMDFSSSIPTHYRFGTYSMRMESKTSTLMSTGF